MKQWTCIYKPKEAYFEMIFWGIVCEMSMWDQGFHIKVAVAVIWLVILFWPIKISKQEMTAESIIRKYGAAARNYVGENDSLQNFITAVILITCVSALIFLLHPMFN